MKNLEGFGSIELSLNELQNIDGGHMSPGQCAASAVAAVAAGAVLGVLPGVFAAIRVAISCG
ncbi:hypothetical protein NBT05_04030 [Aquimarina sp. ERC-38]|uniref:hypothetical protein n=1 Tax=Aquimarina sp. ERC-38 TaxID=2949996 RepID=UPI002246F76E|nr:hypothetical protein [Aquimarina sp. ERC-38]UZO81645.1 hypothetical protein NBT05_04030 [Aquimarina sp. ERC-38]